MEIDKLKQWLDMAQKYQADHFWKEIFEDKNSQNKSSTNPFTVAQEFIPKCDLYQYEENLILDVEIPGLRKEDLHITVNHQLLTIMGEFKSLQQNSKYYLKERANRSFKKEITLPFPVIISEINTELNNGILRIKMPLNHDEIENVPITIDPSILE